MQPYVFPYLGYYQLIRAVDHFVVLDDVTYIKQGWINRNQILVEGRAAMFSVPLEGASSHAMIRDVLVNGKSYSHWRTKFLKTLAFNYRKAPFFAEIGPIVEDVIAAPGTERVSIRDIAVHSLDAVMRYLRVPFPYSLSSDYAKPDDVRGADRVLLLCRARGADTYCNLPGGAKLYDRDAFRSQGITLEFLTPHDVVYPQNRANFVPGLSMLDVLMFNSREAVRTMLGAYALT